MDKANSLYKHLKCSTSILLMLLCLCTKLTAQEVKSVENISPDSIVISNNISISDSIDLANQAKLKALNEQTQAMAPKVNKRVKLNEWKPNPTKATWYAIVFPGGGQIYN